MGRTIHIGDGSGGYARIDIPDDAADKLLASGLLYECGEPEDHPGHDLHINPTWDKFANIETLVLGIARAQNKTFTIGEVTMAHVFEPSGMKNMSDMQAVMNEVERALVAMGAAPDVPAPGPGEVSITTNGTTRIIPADEPVFLLRGQDAAASQTVKRWCDLAQQTGASGSIIEEAFAHAKRMEAWPRKKVPDLPAQHVPIDEHLPKHRGVPAGVKIEEGRVRKGGRNEDPTAGFARRPEAPSGSAPEHKGLPVAGYKPTQSTAAVDLVNEGKELEERVLRWIERVDYDTMGFRIGGAYDIQKGFMQVYRAVFQPNGSRIRLPEDPAENEVPF